LGGGALAASAHRGPPRRSSRSRSNATVGVASLMRSSSVNRSGLRPAKVSWASRRRSLTCALQLEWKRLLSSSTARVAELQSASIEISVPSGSVKGTLHSGRGRAARSQSARNCSSSGLRVREVDGSGPLSGPGARGCLGAADLQRGWPRSRCGCKGAAPPPRRLPARGAGAGPRLQRSPACGPRSYTGLQFRVVTCWPGRERRQWRLMPARGFTRRATATSGARVGAGSSSQRAAADRWLRAAPSPTASTAASQCPSILNSRGATTA
jgi:hypothetical protein